MILQVEKPTRQKAVFHQLLPGRRLEDGWPQWEKAALVGLAWPILRNKVGIKNYIKYEVTPKYIHIWERGGKLECPRGRVN